MIELRIDASTTRQLRSLLTKLRKADEALKHRKPVHQRIKQLMTRRWTVNFNSQGGMYGDWAPLRPMTMRIRQEEGYGGTGPKLLRTGTLRGGFISQAKGGKVTDNATEWNFQRNPIYLYIHHFGGANRGLGGRFGPIPSRPIWGLNETDERMSHDEMEKYVDKIIAKHF
jgi:phage gpG-like protein